MGENTLSDIISFEKFIVFCCLTVSLFIYIILFFLKLIYIIIKMIKFLPIIIFYSNLILLKTQFNYFSTLETNLSLINGTYSTVVISESKDLGSCTCDLTPDSCDYLCCCDPECPTKITSIWISDPNNICLDKSNIIKMIYRE
jgi:hypothetical protein